MMRPIKGVFRHSILFFSATLLLSQLVSCGGGGSSPSTGVPTNFTAELSPEISVLTASQRATLGFTDGPPDGTLGVLLDGGTYMFFAAARSSSTCAGTPSTQGAYRLGGSLTAITAPFGCTAVIQPSSSSGDPNGYTFDLDYAGGGPVLAVTNSMGQTGILLAYHGEWHGGTCAPQGNCFYASLGMAVSVDGGATFSKLGEIVQPYMTRTEIISANSNLDVGGGTLIVADGNGQHIENPATSDPSDVYLYVFYADRDPSAASSAPCNTDSCIAVARALLSDVVNAAFARNTGAFPMLFQKYWQGAFTQPATSSDPNAASNSGHYTPVIAEAGSFPSVLYDNSTQQYLIAYTTDNDAIALRHGPSLLSWSQPVASAAIVDGTDKILYATLIGEGSDPTTADGDPWLYYVRDPIWPDWSSADVVNRRVQLLLTQAN
jgi:hypothetical protein